MKTVPVILLLLLTCRLAQANTNPLPPSGFALLTGFGESRPGWGDTRLAVKEFDLIPRYRHLITENIGLSWLPLRHDLLVEIPMGLMMEPETSFIGGLTFLACFSPPTKNSSLTPYFFAGGGIHYIHAQLPGMALHLNGNYQSGGGLSLAVSPRMRAHFEIRLHHVSNASTRWPNDPLNSFKILGGFSF